MFCNEVDLLVYQEKEGEERGGYFCGEGKFLVRVCSTICTKKIQPCHLTLILSKLGFSDWFMSTLYWWYWWCFSFVRFWAVTHPSSGPSMRSQWECRSQGACSSCSEISPFHTNHRMGDYNVIKCANISCTFPQHSVHWELKLSCFDQTN